MPLFFCPIIGIGQHHLFPIKPHIILYYVRQTIMKKHIKSYIEKHAPMLLDTYRAVNNRRIFGRRYKNLHKRMHNQLYGNDCIEVLSGPFKGLKYFNEVVWGPITPKWLGSYEIELSSIIEEIIARDYEKIIDIGCAEGYYAVGLASRISRSNVFAFDTDFISRNQTKRLARLNALEDRVYVSNYCSSEDISRLATGRSLIVCDIEGFERSLLDPTSCPSLSFLDILVEVHEGSWRPNTLELLKSRFHASHTIEEVVATDRIKWVSSMMSTIPILKDRDLLLEAVNEHRSNGQKWLWMKTNTE